MSVRQENLHKAIEKFLRRSRNPFPVAAHFSCRFPDVSSLFFCHFHSGFCPLPVPLYGGSRPGVQLLPVRIPDLLRSGFCPSPNFLPALSCLRARLFVSGGPYAAWRCPHFRVKNMGKDAEIVRKFQLECGWEFVGKVRKTPLKSMVKSGGKMRRNRMQTAELSAGKCGTF